jgi:hypothetical protein
MSLKLKLKVVTCLIQKLPYCTILWNSACVTKLKPNFS